MVLNPKDGCLFPRNRPKIRKWKSNSNRSYLYTGQGIPPEDPLISRMPFPTAVFAEEMKKIKKYKKFEKKACILFEADVY